MPLQGISNEDLQYIFSWLLLSGNPRDSLKYIYFDICTSIYQICRNGEKINQTRQSAQWGMYTPDQHYCQFLTSTKYVALTLEMAGWMNSMLIAISPKPLGRRITKFNKRSWWYSYINLDAIFFLLLYDISKSVTLTWRSYPISTNMSNINEIPQRFLMVQLYKLKHKKLWLFYENSKSMTLTPRSPLGWGWC